MKRFLLALILLGISVFQLMAQTDAGQKPSKQDDGEIKTLFNNPQHPVSVGFYVSPEGAYTKFGDRDVFLAGLSLGAIINHYFSIGLAANGIVNPGNLWYSNIKDSAGAYLYGGYGGLKLEFKVWPSYPVHLSFPLLIGGGGMVYNTWSYHHQDQNNYNYNGTTLDWDAFFVVEPGVMVELNLLKFMRLDAGVTYRYTPDLHLVNTSSGLINNFNANLSLKFGKF
ncbi:MAG: hypothetical protein NT040_06655 [Bacteroidetes bacterium]|nr:hypothetical protein [Bacteroidota bacterium]